MRTLPWESRGGKQDIYFSVQANSLPNDDSVTPDGATKDLVRCLKLLADETRLRILFHLLDEPELNVRSLCAMLKLSQPAVSHHLGLLRADGLIECRRDGKHHFYRLVPDRFGEMVGKMLAAVGREQTRVRLGNLLLTIAATGQSEPLDQLVHDEQEFATRRDGAQNRSSKGGAAGTP